MKIIGIDPDLHKSGIAVYEKGNGFTMCKCLYLWELFEFLLNMIKNNEQFIVLLEHSFVTNTWHKGGKGAALNVGKNQAISIIIKEFMEFHNIKFELKKPAGYSQFFDNERVFKQTTGWADATNKDARAAAAIVWAYIA